MPECHQIADDDGKPEGGTLEDGIGHPKLGDVEGANAQVKQGVQNEEGVDSDVGQEDKECEQAGPISSHQSHL